MTIAIRLSEQAVPEQLVLRYLRTHPEIRNAQARELTGITCEMRMKEVFYRLRAQGLIQRIEGRRGNMAAWQLVEARPSAHQVCRVYGEAQGFQVGLVVCPINPHGATLKVVVGAPDTADIVTVAVVADAPEAEAEADRIGGAVLRALQVAGRPFVSVGSG